MALGKCQIAAVLHGGKHRNMTYEEEAEFLEQYLQAADGGHITDVSATKSAYDEKIGYKTGCGQIYKCAVPAWLEQKASEKQALEKRDARGHRCRKN